MKRVFVALPLPDEVRANLARLGGGLGGGSAGVLWAEPQNLHLTLRFIGDTDEGRIRDLEDELETITEPAFQFDIEGLGQFGDNNPRILWAGIKDDETLQHLQKKIELTVVRCGFEAETRKFTPHITLARLRRVSPDALARFIESRGRVFEGPVDVTRFQLVQSLRGENGPIYQPLRDYPLEGAPPVFDPAEFEEFSS